MQFVRRVIASEHCDWCEEPKRNLLYTKWGKICTTCKSDDDLWINSAYLGYQFAYRWLLAELEQICEEN